MRISNTHTLGNVLQIGIGCLCSVGYIIASGACAPGNEDALHGNGATMAGGRTANDGEYPSSVFLLEAGFNAEDSVNETGVIIDDYLVLTPAHLVAHLRDYRIENTMLVNPNGTAPMLVIQGNLPQGSMEEKVVTLVRTAPERIRYVDHIVFADGFEEVMPGIYKNDLAAIVTAGYGEIYNAMRNQGIPESSLTNYKPFPDEWQAKVSGPIQWAVSQDPNDRFDCRVDFVSYGMPTIGEKRVGSLCQVWGALADLDGYWQILQPYLEEDYSQVVDPEISFDEYLQLQHQIANLDVGPRTDYVGTESAFHSKQISTAAPPSAVVCESDSGGGLYLRGTNILVGILASGPQISCEQAQEWSEITRASGIRLTPYNKFINTLRDTTRSPE